MTDYGWKFVQHIVFDHEVHAYTHDEVAQRLEPHLGREAQYEQSYDRHRTGMMGVLGKEGHTYELRNQRPGGAHVNLSEQLTAAQDPYSGEQARYTLLTVDRTDLHERAREEHEMLERITAN